MVTIGIIGIGGVGPEILPHVPWTLEQFDPAMAAQSPKLVYVESEPEADHLPVVARDYRQYLLRLLADRVITVQKTGGDTIDYL